MKTTRPAGWAMSAALALAILLLPRLAWSDDDAGVGPDAGAPDAMAPDAGAPDAVPDGGADARPPGDGGVAGEAGAAPAATPTPEPEPAPEPAGTGLKPPRGNRGAVVGVVVDGKTGEPMIEAQVSVVGTKRRVLTDLEGNYRLEIAPGTYELRIWAELKAARRIKGVEIEKGKIVRLDVKLDDDSKATLKEVVVVAAPDKATEAVQVVRRQKAATVSDAVSAEQIARSPDSNASDAVKRVVGATIQDGKYVIIRGLGGRYSLTLLNGVSLPSPDPDLPAAPLDLFPAALLANLTIAKTFTPDIPGNFAGGALMIESRDFPSKFTFKLRLGTSGDSLATGRSLNTYQGGAIDFLGYDDGTRKLPTAVPRDRPVHDPSDRIGDPLALTPEQYDAAGQSFPNKWDLYKHNALPNLTLGGTVGDTLSLGGRRVGYLATVNYGNRWSRQREHVSRVGEMSADGTRLPSPMQLDGDIGTNSVALGTLANVGLMLSSAHRLSLIGLYTHTADKSAAVVTGKEANENIINRQRFRFLERAMAFSQLLGEHSFGGGRLLLAWQGNIAHVAQDEPDTRDLYRVQETDGVYRVGRGTGTAERVYGELGELTGGGGFDVTIPFSAVRFKLGGSALLASRQSRVRRFHFEVGDRLRGLSSEEIFLPQNIGHGVTLDEQTYKEDGFDADRGIYAGYLMADLLRLDPVRVIAGARYEVATLDLELNQSLGVAPDQMTKLSRTDKKPLPALNVVYALGTRSNLRGAYSITVARPHLRELSVAPFFDYVRRRVISGKADLKETTIHNGDLRWEMFLENGEVLAASAFYKHFLDPIERTIVISGDGQNLSFRNADSARSYGLELESRITGGRFSPKLSALYLGGNFTLVRSRILGEGVERPLQGQSPYAANAELGFRRNNTQVALLYNVFGPRVSEVAVLMGETDVIERPVHRLDLAWSQKLGRGFSLKLTATNLLNQRTVFVQNDVEILAYKLGVTGSATLEWSYENGKEQ
ncbi:MAG TPA: TonB-dependent receptor [Polyangia bacterium]|nr:TonB-dependent receptor [Polyangia bacterium]